MATFYKFGKLWEIPPAAARLGKSRPANTQAFETFLTNLEPMYSAFICAHPRCPKDPDLPAIRYAIKEFMERQAPSNFMKERWAASYDPARKVTYVSWFLGTIAYFLDKLDFTALVPPPVETEFPVFIAEPPSAPIDPAPPQFTQAPAASSSSAAARQSGQPIAPAAPAAQPGRQSRLWNAGGLAGLAALEARNAAERQAQLCQRPQRLRPQDPPSVPAPAAAEQRHAPANSTMKLFSCARTTRTRTTPPAMKPFGSLATRTRTTTHDGRRTANPHTLAARIFSKGSGAGANQVLFIAPASRRRRKRADLQACPPLDPSLYDKPSGHGGKM